MHAITPARVEQIYQIKRAGDEGRFVHPDYAAIKDAERRFIDEPIVNVYVKTGLHPDRLRFTRPSTDIEAACQWVAARLLNQRLGRPVIIEYTTPPLKPPKRIAHAFRVVRRMILRR